MSRATSALLTGLMALLTAGCGSNETRNDQPAPVTLATESGSTLESAPTAQLVATDDATAGNLATEIQQSLQDLAQLGQVAGAQGDAQTSATTSRVVKAESNADTDAGARPTVMATTRSVVYTCAQFLGAGASGTITYTFVDAAPTVGWQSSLAFKDCAFAFGVRAYKVNGTLLYEYVRYVSGSDFGFVGRTEDLVLATSLNGQQLSAVKYALTYAFDIRNGVITTSYATPSSVFRDLRVATSGNQVVVNLSAVIDMKERRGAVRIKLQDWRYDLPTGHAVGGSAVVTGANGTRADVQPSTTGYTVTYTDSTGKTKVYAYVYTS
jgi:hypothetical protein